MIITDAAPLSRLWTHVEQYESVLSEKVQNMQLSGQIGFCAVGFCIFGALIAAYKNKKSSRSRASSSKQIIDPRIHLDIIKFKPVGGVKTKITNQQLMRALPNQRLRVVFGIDNAFTTEDEHAHNGFVAAATRKMQDAIHRQRRSLSAADGDWTELREVARAAVIEMLSLGQEKLRLVDLVRVVTLKVVLRFLFHASDDAINSSESIGQLILIGQSINDLWIASKQAGANKTPRSWDSDANTALHDALRVVCASNDAAQPDIDPLIPAQNPMNWLLPAYETMWRVVLSCILELHFRTTAGDAPRWREMLQSYIDNLSREAFKGPVVTPGGVRAFSVNDIVKETLRLYPPTRRVYRRFPDMEHDVIADIEACHRSTADNAFGTDALSFRPERWVKMRQELGGKVSDKDVKKMEGKRGFMPFAFFCPAGIGSTQGFGLKMIALLAGVVGEGLLREEGKWRLEHHDGAEWELAQPLPSDRPAFDGVFLVKRKI